MSITIYDPVTGDLLKVVSGPSLAVIAPEGDAPFVVGAHSPLFFKVDLATGQVVARDAG